MRQYALALLLLLFLQVSKAQTPLKAVSAFLETLDPAQKNETVFPFDDGERLNYHFIPFVRKGITFNEMNWQQQAAAIRLMRSCLSENAYEKTRQIREMERVLKAMEKRKPDDHYRDSGNYHFSIFGIPSVDAIWGWRFEGHHISFNFTFRKNRMVSGTPAFLGSNPGVVMEGTLKGREILKDETEYGQQFLAALSAGQLKKAIADTVTPNEILSADKRKVLMQNNMGIAYPDLSAPQQAMLRKLIDVYVHRFTHLFAEDMLQEIQNAGLDKLRFTWIGDTTPGPGHPHYYRVMGPTLLIEYDNTQDHANHVHSVVRDLQHDFGGDALLEHYQTAHNHP
ncbi:MAG TPA: DUF3500 domain-containing protein [Sediminibacterium sp.]|nr:DUF3500 domain-containing protein [Sediminibacterium sp.]